MSNEAKNVVRIADVAQVIAGFPFRGAIQDDPDGETAVIQMRNVSSDREVVWSDVARVDLSNQKKARLICAGDVLFAARGSNSYAVHIDSVRGRAVCSPHFFVISVNARSKILPAFLAWQINQKPVQGQIDAAATGSYIRNIRRKALESIQITVPSLERQQLIVAFYETARAERALLQRLIENRNTQLDALALGLSTSNGV